MAKDCKKGAYMKTNNGKNGGMLKGKKHTEGGIQAIVTDAGNKPVELETNEAILSAKTMKSNKKYNFEGKQRTPKEIASTVNVEHGGNPIMARGGEITFCGILDMDISDFLELKL